MINSSPLPDTAGVRLVLGLTQQQLADSLGISRSLVAMAETGKRSMPSTTLPLLKSMQRVAVKIQRPQMRTGSHSQANGFTRLPLLRRSGTASRNSRASLNSNPAVQRWSLPVMTRYAATAPQKEYSVQRLQNQADCGEMIRDLSLKKEMQEHYLQYLHIEKAAAGERAIPLQAQLQILTVQLDTGLQIMTQYPVERIRRKFELLHAKQYYKKLLLQKKLDSCNAPAQLQRELRISIAEKWMIELDRLMDTVSRRMEVVG